MQNNKEAKCGESTSGLRNLHLNRSTLHCRLLPACCSQKKSQPLYLYVLLLHETYDWYRLSLFSSKYRSQESTKHFSDFLGKLFPYIEIPLRIQISKKIIID